MVDLTDAMINEYEDFVERLSDALGLKDPRLQRFATVQEASRADLRDRTNSQRNILGVGYGEKLTGGVPQGVLAIGIYVVRKASRTEVNANFLAESLVQTYLPPGYLSDVIEVGCPELLHHATYTYPNRLPGGVAIGDTAVPNYGTLGGWVLGIEDRYLFLSCWHCIDGGIGGTPGKAVRQPPNGSRIAQVTASIDPTVPFSRTNFFGRTTQTTIDACIARPDDPQCVGDFILRIGEIRSPQRVKRTYLQVCKSGAITHRTTGIIVQNSGNMWLHVPSLGRRVYYQNQLLIQPGPLPFASPGDSGSLVLLNEPGHENHVVGLLIGGNNAPPIYIATPILEVIDAFGNLHNMRFAFIEYH